MQPRTLAIIITLLPLFIVNTAYLMSASAGHVSWCMPFFEGCTTISQAGRSGDTLYFFRATMSVYAVLMMVFWLYVYRWFESLAPQHMLATRVICWLGIIGAAFLILYITYLGSTGPMQDFLRRYGIIVYFTFTPLAQLLMLRQHYKLKPGSDLLKKNRHVLNYHKIILLLMLLIGVISVILKYAGLKSYESENIVEWNFSLLIMLYCAGMAVLWKDFRIQFKN